MTSVRALRVEAHGQPLVFRDLTLANPLPGEVRLTVTHVALNHLDTWVRRGVPGHDFRLPKTLGSDVVGVVDGARYALHPSWGCGQCPACVGGRENRCRHFRLRGENTDGGAVTALNVPTEHLLAVPEHLSSAEAAALPLTLLTAWHMLRVRAALQDGERVLVQAGGSGVGVMAIQIARNLGCAVWATASTPERRERLAALGARPLDYSEVAQLRDIDVVCDSVGATTWDANLRCLSWGGRLVICGATSGAEAKVNLRALFFKQLSLLGSTMGTREDMRAAWAEVQQGAIRPVVHTVLPWAKAQEGHMVLEGRHAFGKVVLEVS